MAEEVHLCPVCDLLGKNFGSRSTDEKINIIKLGRPVDTNIVINTVSKTCVRKFNVNLFETNEWLTACPKKQKLFCWSCLLLSNEHTVWSRTGYCDIRHIHKAIKKHTTSQSHLLAVIREKTFGKVKSDYILDAEKKSIEIQHNDLVKKNREMIRRIIDIVCFLGKQELTFGLGLEESSESSNTGNYDELLKLLSLYDDNFNAFLQNNAVISELSNSIQNHLIESISHVLMSHITSEIEDTKFISLSLDETTDLGYCSQISVSIRYVSVEGEINERFLRLINIENRTVGALYSIVNDLMKEYNCGDKLICQSYDGAAVIPGHLKDLQSRVKQTFPQALFVHSYVHNLNLIFTQVLQPIRDCRIFFITLNEIVSFISKCIKSIHSLEEKLKKRLEIISQIQWNSHYVQKIHDHKNEILDFLKIMSPSDQKCIFGAVDILSTMEDFNFIFLLELFAYIFQLTDIQYVSIPDLENKVMKLEILLKKKRDSFDEFWTKLFEVEEPPSKRQKPEVDNEERKTHYSNLYYKIFDTILQHINERFNHLELFHFFELLNMSNFEAYSHSFPEKALQSLDDTFSCFFDIKALKSQLSAIYTSEDMRHKSVNDLLYFIKTSGLHRAFNEASKLCELMLTFPITSVSTDGRSSKLENIKNYSRNMQQQKRLASLSLISLEKELLTNLQQHQIFYDNVTDEFAKKFSCIKLQFM